MIFMTLLKLYDQDMIKDEFMGSITFDPASLYAIQQVFVKN